MSCIAATLASGTAQAAPATDHPRLWITSSDLPRLQSWATASNPMYQNGLLAAANAAKSDADSKWNWTTGKPNSSWQDDGGTNWEGEATEAYAEMFAFMSLVDPVTANRPQWAMRSRAMLMWAINQAANCTATTQPFCDPTLPSYNRGNAWGEAWGLTVDWIYSSLSAADKATIRKVFLKWANDLYTVTDRAGNAPYLPGVLNSPKTLGNDSSLSAYQAQQAQLQLRWSANNYTIGEMRYLTLMSLAMDAADDPAVDATKPATQIGNSLRSYISDVTGWWLYKTYAVFADPVAGPKALGLTGANISTGIASGGLPVEGSLYGESLGFMAEGLLALNTAGYSDTTAYGPQVGFLSDPFWDKSVDGLMHLMAPQPFTPSAASGNAYMGQIWPIGTYGDTLRTWLDPFGIGNFGPLAILDQRTGADPQRLAKSKWLAANALEGGPAMLYNRAANVWGNSNATFSIFYFMMFDPNGGTSPADPRPAMATQFAAPQIGSVLARTGWDVNASGFGYRCGWETINHESGDCGQFEYYRKGQFLTKEWSNYAMDWRGYTSLYHNTLALQNSQPASLNGGIWAQASATGSQYNNGGNDGDPTSRISVNDNWAFAQSDMTNLYNHPDWWTAANNAMDIQAASRSIVWENPDTIVIYDRAQSAKAGEFKRFNLVLQAAPKISGKTATITSGGQTLTVQSLMPANATIAEQHVWTTNPASEVDQTSLLDTSYDRLVIQDSSNPQSVRFLTVLEGTDAGYTAAVASAVHSSSGSAYDGAVVGNFSVVFPVTLGQAFSGTTYTVPAGVTRHMVTGLTPGAAYSMTVTASGGAQQIAVGTGGSLVADVGGVIAIGFPASAHPTLGGQSTVGTALIAPPGSVNSTPASGGSTPPASGGGSTSGGGTTTGGSTGSSMPTQGHGAPNFTATEGFYYYDNWDQEVFWYHNNQWVAINDGLKQTYTATTGGWQGPGAPQQLISNGAKYHDTVEGTNYVQQGNSWILVTSTSK